MADKKDELYGYDIVNEIETGGRFLAFKKGDKGRIIHIRLASKPQYINQHWILQADGKQVPIRCTGDDCPHCGKAVAPKDKMDKVAKWGWVVIDRADGNVKMFTGPTLIARKIKDLIEDPDWGNPFLYDIKIKRNEEPGAGYYAVTPVPTGKGQEITDEEKKKVTDAAIDLTTELDGSKESKHLGNYEEGAAVPDGKEDVNPDDIPF